MAETFLSLHPFYEGGPINGRKVANAGFMDALLAFDPFDAYHFFVGNPSALEAFWHERMHLSAVQRGAVHVMARTELVEHLRTTPYSVCHFSDPVTDFAPMMALRNAFAPHIFPITAVNHSINYQSYAPAFLAHMWQGCCSRDAIGANSRAAAEVLRHWYTQLRTNYNLDACCITPQIQVQPMGVHAEVIAVKGSAPHKQQRTHMRTRLAVAEDTTLLLVFGRISMGDKMDIHPLLLALRRACATLGDKSLCLAISGYCEENDNACAYIETIARSLHIPVHILPNPSDADKAALFAAADVFVSPSDNIQETFGLSLLEAGAAGLPVIASDWDGYKDIIIHQQTGILVPTLAPDKTPCLDACVAALYDNQHQFARSQRTVICVPEMAEAIVYLTQDHTARMRMGEAAQQRIREEFTWSSVVKRWCAFWEQLQKTPLTPQEEQRLKNAHHPMLLRYGEAFAHYPSNALAATVNVACSAFGLLVRKGQYPLEGAGRLPHGMQSAHVRQYLTLARTPVSVAALLQRCPHEPELGMAYILWLLKHDLLERVLL